MSEYQFVHFLAIDRPLDDKQLAFMEQQSTRAEITRWQFTNEYHYGDFHGNPREMLRRGYDVHLHYANFGMRRVMIRLPGGPPCDRRTFDAFRSAESVAWDADKQGKGGILVIEPEADAGTYEEDLYDVDGLLPEIAPIREQLMSGDLRALYVAWLACAYDEESLEPPVPAGLDVLDPALGALARLYGVSVDLIAAAAQQAPPLPKTNDAAQTRQNWIARRSEKDLRTLVQSLLGDDAAAARAETMARVRSDTGTASWPLAKPTRTLAQLRAASEHVRQQRLEQQDRARATARRKRLKSIATDPGKLIANVEKLVKSRSVDSYKQAAQELADLRDALGPESGPKQAQAVAEKLRRENPRLHHLTAALRKHGLLEKGQ